MFMYRSEDFRCELNNDAPGVAVRDLAFIQEMFDAMQLEEEGLYEAQGEKYHLKLGGAGFSPHGRRQTLRVNVAFELVDRNEGDGHRTGLETMTLTYTFSPQLSPEKNLRRFRNYVARRASDLVGIEPKPVQ